MNTETKRHIDAARQVLVGVVPNPTSQIDQITNALIYKFMDDMDQASIKSGGEPSFFVGDLEKYAWTRLMDTKIGNQDRMNLYVEALSKFSESANLPELFRNIFRSAFLPYRSPEVLGLFLKEINYFDYSHPEELGNAYEYLLSIMSSQGDAGQFRTPRHIIDFIVDVVDPTKDEKVLDPACGTGGFLVSAYRRILEHHDGKNDPSRKEKPLTPDDRKNIMNNFEGYDIDPGMVRIAQVNMYLHQFKNPKIYQYDTLSMDERWNDKFDVILANPPFMSPKGGIKPHSKFSMQSTRSEVLFVDYIKNHLRPNGRAGIIVPEGIIFQSGTAYKQLRKALVEDGLYAVVSLPSGVFQPYSGVKTSILLFDNQIAKLRDSILFIKVENDGYTLGATRTKSDKNDLPKARVILAYYKECGQVLTENVTKAVAYFEGQEIPRVTWSDMAQLVEKKKIAEGGDYSLSKDRYYSINTNSSSTAWELVELGRIIELRFGTRITKSNESGTKYPVYGGGGESFRTDEYNRENEYVISRFAMSENCVRFVAGQFWLLDSGGTFVIKPEFKYSVNKDYIGKILHGIQQSIFRCGRGGAQKNLNIEQFYEISIPIPPLVNQERIVAELDGYQKIIDGAKQVVENWKPKFEIDPKWEKVKLGDVCIFVRGPFGGSLKKEIFVNDGYVVYEQSHAIYSDFTQFRYFIDDVKFHEMKRFEVNPDDLIMSCSGTMGKTAIIPVNARKGIINQALLKLTVKDKLNARFLKIWMDSPDFQVQLLSQVSGVAIQNIASVKVLQNLIISLPFLEIQNKIVESIESERAKVENAKELIPIYQQRIKETIAKLWSE